MPAPPRRPSLGPPVALSQHHPPPPALAVLAIYVAGWVVVKHRDPPGPGSPRSSISASWSSSRARRGATAPPDQTPVGPQSRGPTVGRRRAPRLRSSCGWSPTPRVGCWPLRCRCRPTRTMVGRLSGEHRTGQRPAGHDERCRGSAIAGPTWCSRTSWRRASPLVTGPIG